MYQPSEAGCGPVISASPTRQAFLHEYRIPFPIGIDKPDDLGQPHTMRSYGLEDTPTTLLIDRVGRLRRQTLGHIPNLQLGTEIMALIGEGRLPMGVEQPDGMAACRPGECT